MFTKLARQAAEYRIKQGELLPAPYTTSPELARQQACFVTVMQNPGRRIRASFGLVLPQKPSLALEIISNTNMALALVPGRLTRLDIPTLLFSIGLLSPLERISEVGQLNPSFYGLHVVTERGKTSTVLPGRIGIETPQDQLATAIREANVASKDDTLTMYRFTITSFSD